jgi:hypothetical protein
MNAIVKNAAVSVAITAFNGPEPTPNPDLSDPKAIVAERQGQQRNRRQHEYRNHRP